MGRKPLDEEAKYLEVRIKEGGVIGDKLREILEKEKEDEKCKTLSKAAASVILKHGKIKDPEF